MSIWAHNKKTSKKKQQLLLAYDNLTAQLSQIQLSHNQELVKFKLELASTMTNALELINSGKVQINNRKIKMPNYICSSKDTISVFTEKGNSPRKIKLADYLRTV